MVSVVIRLVQGCPMGQEVTAYAVVMQMVDVKGILPVECSCPASKGGGMSGSGSDEIDDPVGE